MTVSAQTATQHGNLRVEHMEHVEWEQEKRRSPFVMAGALVTGAILGAGLFAYKSGNKNLSQHMMRARVVAQGVTVALMLGTSGAMVMGGEER